MRTIGSCIIGALCGIKIPFLNIAEGTFNITNLLTTIGLVILWYIIYNMFTGGNNETY